MLVVHGTYDRFVQQFLNRLLGVGDLKLSVKGVGYAKPCIVEGFG